MSSIPPLEQAGVYIVKIHHRLLRSHQTANSAEYKAIGEQLGSIIGRFSDLVREKRKLKPINWIRKANIHSRADELRIEADMLYRDCLAGKLPLFSFNELPAPHPVYGNVPDLAVRFRPPPSSSDKKMQSANQPQTPARTSSVNGRTPLSHPRLWKPGSLSNSDLTTHTYPPTAFTSPLATPTAYRHKFLSVSPATMSSIPVTPHASIVIPQPEYVNDDPFVPEMPNPFNEPLDSAATAIVMKHLAGDSDPSPGPSRIR